jgi:hypothetical protein
MRSRFGYCLRFVENFFAEVASFAGISCASCASGDLRIVTLSCSRVAGCVCSLVLVLDLVI